jgi:hypothetical protein
MFLPSANPKFHSADASTALILCFNCRGNENLGEDGSIETVRKVAFLRCETHGGDLNPFVSRIVGSLYFSGPDANGEVARQKDNDKMPWSLEEMEYLKNTSIVWPPVHALSICFRHIHLWGYQRTPCRVPLSKSPFVLENGAGVNLLEIWNFVQGTVGDAIKNEWSLEKMNDNPIGYRA